MIIDIENNLSLNDNKYDDVKAYKIIKHLYDDSKEELERMKNRFEKNELLISEKQNEYDISCNSYDENTELFTPSALRSNTLENIELINHELLSLKETSRYISENILKLTEKVAEYSYLLSYFSVDNTSSIITNIEEISDKIDFCISLIDVDRERVKEELFHVKHLLK